MELIDKSDLVAEIEKIKSDLSPDFHEYDYDAAKVEVLGKIEKFLDTFEVKEIDINKEISRFIDANFAKTTPGTRLHLRRVAKYFFELGLKQKVNRKENNMETPEKIYLFENPVSNEPDDRWLSKRSCDEDVEYIRATDVKKTLVEFMQYLNKRGFFRDDLCFDTEHQVDTFIELQDKNR